MQGTIVAVFRGGPSREHDVSIATGASVLLELPKDRFTVRDIYIDRDGVWHERGVPVLPERVLPSVDVAFVALHGTYGHSGTIQKILVQFGVPYTGSDPYGSYVAMHKVFAREKAREIGLPLPRYAVVDAGGDSASSAGEINRTFMPPVLVGPAFGSSADVESVHGFAPLEKVLRDTLASGQTAIVSERVRGEDVFVGVIENFRDESLYVLPPTGARKEARFAKHIVDEVSRATRAMHEALSLRQYSQSRFMVTAKGVYYLSTSALPPLTHDAPMARAFKTVGIKLSDFFEHVLSGAQQRLRRL